MLVEASGVPSRVDGDNSLDKKDDPAGADVFWMVMGDVGLSSCELAVEAAKLSRVGTVGKGGISF